MQARAWIVGYALMTLLAGSVAAAPGAQAPADEKPDAFVRRVYALYGAHGGSVPMERPAGAQYYAPEMLDAFAKDVELAKGEVGAIDGDPICDCQDNGKLRVKSVAITGSEPGLVRARVIFTNLGSQNVVTLVLRHLPEGWRIADVENKDSGSVMTLLRNEFAHPVQDDPPAPSSASPSKP
jgi:hypothetical protein